MSVNQLSDSQIASYASQAGFSSNALVIAVAVALAESGGVANARHLNNNGTTDYGLWQINSVHSQYDTTLLVTNPLYNAQAAYALSSGGRNWAPWTTYTNGAYQQYIPRATVAASIFGASKGTPTTTTTLTTNPTPVQSIPLWCQPFMAHSAAWWEANGNHYPTSSEGFYEGGVDWDPNPKNAPITALLPGVVVGAGYFCGGGPWALPVGGTCASRGKSEGWGVVTIRSTNPYPTLVPGALIDIYYQHIRIAPSIQINLSGGTPSQVVAQGQQIGNGNGSFNVEVGVNIGTQWGPIWGGKSPGPHVDPIPFLWTLIHSGIAGSPFDSSLLGGTGIGGTTFGPTKTYTPLLEQVHETLINTPGFYGIALSLDEAEQFPGFIDLTQSEQVSIPLGGSVDVPFVGSVGGSVGDITLPVPDVAGGVRSVGATITDNFVPFAIRSGLVLFGVFMFIMLFAKAISGPVSEILPTAMEAMS